jgi:hypothetical protein
VRLDVVVTLFVGLLAGYATARAIDAQGWRIQRRAAERLARAEVRRLRALLGPTGGGTDAALALLATVGAAPVRLHSAVERLLRRDVGLLSDAALVLLLQLDDALRALEGALERVWQDAMTETAAEALRPADAGATAGAVVTRLVNDEVAARLAPPAPPPPSAGRTAAARCLHAAQEVRALLDALEAATAERPSWPARLRARVRARLGAGAAPADRVADAAAFRFAER